MSDRPRLTVTLEPAAELEHRDLAQRVPDFEDAYGEPVRILSARPRRGWPLSGGRWGYALARRGKPRVRVIYTFNHTSGHSTFGAAAAEMLALIIGRDDIAFSGRSPDEVLWPQLRGVERHWTSLSQMADENGMSRIYGGVHWDVDHSAAMKAGKAIARQAFHTAFPRKA